MQDIQEYGAWRASIATALEAYRAALAGCDVLDAAATQRAAQAAARVRDDRLSVAFVAEFSRGKSELINAIFFADYGQRILPSSAGRTTMCPTELLYDAAWAPCIRLLPIETRAHQLSTSDYRDDAAAWTVIPLELDAPERMAESFRQVSMTRRVPPEEAQRYGLYDPEDPELADALGADGLVEISQWRHAIINLPHPLLKQGLVILDTPGLNAIGTEPELTLNLIPNAHAVLFVLAAETGVTRSDIEVWRTHIGAGPGRIVVLNKIDAMWDALKSDAQNEAEIARQQHSVAQQLGLAADQVYPVSAQKALVGRIQGDMDLFERSRLGALEAALLHGLIPQKKTILGSALRDDLAALEAAQSSALASRGRGLVEQLQELKSLRGKNQNVLAHMMRRIEAERKDFDAGLMRLQDARQRFASLSTELYSTLDMDAVARQADTVRLSLQAARFATGMRAPVRAFFEQCPRQPGRGQRTSRRDRQGDGGDGARLRRRTRPHHGAADGAVAGPLSRRDRRGGGAVRQAVRHRDPAHDQPQHAARALLRLDRLQRAAQLPRRERRCRGLAEGDHGAARNADPPAQGAAAASPVVDPAHPRCDRQPGAEDRRLRGEPG